MEIKLTRSDQSRRAHFSEHFIYNDNSPYLTCLRNNVSKNDPGLEIGINYDKFANKQS